MNHTSDAKSVKIYIQLILVVFVVLFASVTSAMADVRSYDGTGNNLANPDWGAAGEALIRLGPARYSDLISAPSGVAYPNARDVSNLLGKQLVSIPDPAARSAYVWQWGQFLDHDITLTPVGTEPFHISVNATSITGSMDPLAPMVPMTRSSFDPATGTGIGNPRQQTNINTSFIDASMVYGSDASRASSLRTFLDGQMRTTSGGSMLLINTGGLPNANDGMEPDETMFLAGDVRANEQPGLTAMHTMFVREHNRLATQFAIDNPTWNDEQIYQKTRKYVGGLVQNVTYREYLPSLLGSAAPDVDGAAYDAAVNPAIANEFATAAFRIGHSQVSPTLLRIHPSGAPAAGGDMSIKDTFFSPSVFTSPDEVDYLLYGLAMQVQQRTDMKMIDTLRDTLFGPAGGGGLDLLAINVQRSRDHGLGTYVELQADMGMTPSNNFTDVTSDPVLQLQLAETYYDVTEMGQWVGLLAEDPMLGAAVGPSMARIIGDQFERLMTGDRFFYQWDDELTADEINAISNTTLADIIVRNTAVQNLQGNVFFVPEPDACWVLWLGLVWLGRRRG